MPAYKFNTLDCFYLAVAKKSLDKLTFVYTLVCAGDKGKYDMAAHTEIATFDDPQKAEIYYQTVRAAIDYHKKTEVYKIMIEFNTGLLNNFNQATK